MQNKQINFLVIVRVLATISVFCSHIVFLFWEKNKIVQELFLTPAVVYSSDWYNFLCNTVTALKLNLGPFGVALFFLISGFLFVFSVEKTKDIKEFLSRKAIRIYPIYWGGVCITMLWMYNFHATDTFIYSLKDILVTATLFRPFFSGIPSVDGISWYLECLVVFYIVVSIFNKYFPLEKFENMVLLLVLGLVFKTYWMFFCLFYILIGVCFANLYLGKYSLKQFISVVALGFYAFYYKYKRLDPEKFKLAVINYEYALIVFGGLYALRNKNVIKKIADTKFFKFINKLSYPIYVIHGVCGYVIMANLYAVIPNWFVCVGAATVWTIAASLFLHYVIEQPILKRLKGKQ